MKNYLQKTACVFSYILLLLLTFGCNRHEEPAPSALNIDDPQTKELLRKGAENPDEALVRLDSIMRKGDLPQWKANTLRAFILGQSFANVDSGIQLAKQCLRYDSIRLVPTRHIAVLRFLAKYEFINGHCSDCILHSLDGTKIAEQVGDNNSRLFFDILTGSCMYTLRDKKNGDVYVDKAIVELENSDNRDDMELLSFAYGQVMLNHWYDDTQKSIDAGLKREVLLNKLEEEGSYSRLIDKERCFLFSRMAAFYSLTHQNDKADEYKKKYQKTQYSQTPRGKRTMLDYYFIIGDDANFLRVSHESLSYWENRDSISPLFVHELNMHSTVYARQGNGKKAQACFQRAVLVDDSIKQRESEQESSRLAVLYKVQEKEYQLQQKDILVWRMRLFFVAMAVLCLFASLFAFYSHQQKENMKKKNQQLVKQIDMLVEEQQRNTEMLAETIAQAAAPSQHNNKANFSNNEKKQRFMELFEKEKIYLDPDLSRTKLQEMLKINKNDFSTFLKEVLGDATNLSDFINRMRIGYAVKLLSQRPDLSINQISEASGFYTIRNFRRCFKERTGMTPAEYRETKSQIKSDESSDEED